MIQLKPLSFKHQKPEFGNAIHWTVTGELFNVAMNNFNDIKTKPQYWLNTIWINNLISGEECILDFGITIKSTYKQVSAFIAPIIKDYIKNCHGELDSENLDGTTWTGHITVRAMTKKEIAALEEMGGEFWEKPERDDQFDIRYDGEILPYEECEFDYPLFNQKPDMDIIRRVKKKK